MGRASERKRGLRPGPRFAVDLNAGLGPLIGTTRERANVAGSLITNAVDYARFLVAVLEGRGLAPETHAAMLTPQVATTSRSLFSAPGTDTGAAREMGLSWALGWGRIEAERGAVFPVGREEGCEAYAVAFLKPRTAFVVLSVSPLASMFTGELASALIGDAVSPLEWLEYGRTMETRPWAPSALFVVAGLLVAAVAVIGLARAGKPRPVRASKAP